MHPARRQGLITAAAGLALVALPIAFIAISASLGSSVSTSILAPVLLGWIVLGFGLCELAFAGNLRLVAMLVALLLGGAGMIATFRIIDALGYTFAR
jgi:hypothetical protein